KACSVTMRMPCRWRTRKWFAIVHGHPKPTVINGGFILIDQHPKCGWPPCSQFILTNKCPISCSGVSFHEAASHPAIHRIASHPWHTGTLRKICRTMIQRRVICVGKELSLAKERLVGGFFPAFHVSGNPALPVI